ncbi:MAG: phosphate ABC transporter substrate-binding protein PstS [Porphyromonas sp.]|nr:phosphate ABC transporter substrate-binding protein PstS [Bacteroidales bacterium]MDY3099750.1 phosphate ABC transporter substrate-binding protein PstS [Porphyromonas sp.]
MVRLPKFFLWGLCPGLCLAVLSSCSGSIVSGAGASFPAPFYIEAAKQYAGDLVHNPQGVQISYGAVGSGAGIRNLRDHTVDFGASDVFLSDEEMSEMGAEVIQVSTCIGGVVMAYNLPEVDTLRLNSEVIAKMYLGEITNWRDPAISALNPGVTFPDKPVTPIYRSDGSGTTSVFSSYMSGTNAEWRENIGKGKTIDLGSVGMAAKGNPGVAGNISEIDGSIGYIGSEYSLALGIPSALLQNASGRFVEATMEHISIAGERDDFPDDTRAILSNSPNPDAYPIATMTWVLAYKEQNYLGRTREEARELQDWLLYLVSDAARTSAERTHYAPLPVTAMEKARRVILSMTYDGKPLSTEDQTPKPIPSDER